MIVDSSIEPQTMLAVQLGSTSLGRFQQLILAEIFCM